MDKHKIATKIIAIFMIVAMLIATASTLLYFIFAKFMPIFSKGKSLFSTEKGFRNSENAQ